MRAIALLAVLLQVDLASAKDLAGVGARPLTPTVAATWFIRHVSPPERYEMAAVIFLIDEAGWVNQKTDWKFSPTYPAFSQFKFEKTSYRVELSTDPEIVNLDGIKIPTEKANTFVVSGAASGSPKIVFSERLVLETDFEHDPMRFVVVQSTALRSILGLE